MTAVIGGRANTAYVHDPAYPRPGLVRETHWELLDGVWDFATGDDAPADPTAWGSIVVPFPWQSRASGVEQHWAEHGWYRREIAVPSLSGSEQAILHVGAAHHEAMVWVDGRLSTHHVGGMLGFETDLTAWAGQSVEVTIEVRAPADQRELPHGKQRNLPPDPYDVCSFTPCSGIWQSVWLEVRPTVRVDRVTIRPDAALGGFDLTVDVVAGEGLVVTAAVVGSDDVVVLDGRSGHLSVSSPRWWSPTDPHLYDVAVELRRHDELLDRVIISTGLRRIEVRGRRLHLNGERVYLRGVLDQGYWPESGWAAPDVDALIRDLTLAKEAGFTLVRQHLKLEDPRWLAAADRLGMLVWEEPPCTSVFTPAAVAAFEAQLVPMVERDGHHPCIVVWGAYNEEWGLDWDVPGDPAKQAALARAYDLIRAADPTRPIVDNSGWSHVRTDLADWHVYSPDQASWRSALAELGQGFDVQLGPGGLVRKQIMADDSDPEPWAGLNSEYGTGTTSVERAWIMRWQTQELRRDDDLNGYVYCELYDIEHETAGVLTFGRDAKDDLGLTAAEVHADTVIIVDVDPVRPGLDLVAPAGRVRCDVHLSTHTGIPRRMVVRAAWSPMYGRGDRVSAAVVGEVEVTPYRLSDEVALDLALPPGWTGGRLHLWADDGVNDLAHTVLDVAR